MLRKTNEITKQGQSVYIDENGKKQVLPRIRQKHGVRIPDWCFRYIQPIRATAKHWSLKKNCMVCR